MKAVSRPADNTKVIALGASVVVVFAFVVWRVMSALSGSAPPAPPGDGTIGTQGPEVNLSPLPPPSVEDASDADIIIPIFAPGSTPNPFHKDVLDIVQKQVDERVKRQFVKRGTPRDGPPPETVVVPDTQPIEVKGIAMGGPGGMSVAVISVGDKDYVVDRGATFGRGLRLRSVSESMVVIEEGKQVHNLKVGVKPPPPPAPAPAAAVLPGSALPTGNIGEVHTRTLPQQRDSGTLEP